MIIKKVIKYLVLLIAISSIAISCTEPKVKNKPNSSIKNSYFVNTTWLLESLNGKEIRYPADYKQNFIIFKGESDGFKFSGFAGCNNFSGNYDVGDHGEIGIDNIISTKMSCSFSELENEFIKTLSETTSYKIDGFYMNVFSGKNIIAVFKDAKELQTH